MRTAPTSAHNSARAVSVNLKPFGVLLLCCAASLAQAESIYLKPITARPSEYCFDPDSIALRRALAAPPPELDTQLDAHAFADDVQFLRTLMRRVYAGYLDLAQLPHFDVDAFFMRWEKSLRNKPRRAKVSFDEAVVRPLVELQLALPDLHETALGADNLIDDPRLQVREYQAPVDDSLQTCDNDPASASRPVLAKQLSKTGALTSILTLSARGDRKSIAVTCGDRTITLIPRAEVPAPTTRLPAYEWQAMGNAVAITLRQFAIGPPEVATRLKQLAQDYPQHALSTNIVFDLRNNGGGSLEYIFAWIDKAVRGHWSSYPRLERTGALAPCSVWNAIVERQIHDGRVDDAQARDEREALQGQWQSQSAQSGLQLTVGEHEGHATRPYSGRVFVLVSKRSGSSGELAAVLLKHALHATIVGERTAGAMQFGEARRFVLPATGIVWQMPTKRFFFDTEVEGVGIPVDVYLEDINAPIAAIAPLFH
jgi:hypothetical protein